MTYILLPAALGLAGLYLRHVNTAMKRTPEEALNLSPHRWTVEEVKSAYQKARETPVDVTKSLPPKQTRRYIIVGGSGKFLQMTQARRIFGLFMLFTKNVEKSERTPKLKFTASILTSN
jgi:hypothetical protein